LSQLATATEEELESLGTELDRVEHELRAEVESAAKDTHKVALVQLGGQLKSSLTPLVKLFGTLPSSKATMTEALT
jgi:hypothetical protein